MTDIPQNIQTYNLVTTGRGLTIDTNRNGKPDKDEPTLFHNVNNQQDLCELNSYLDKGQVEFTEKELREKFSVSLDASNPNAYRHPFGDVYEDKVTMKYDYNKRQGEITFEG